MKALISLVVVLVVGTAHADCVAEGVAAARDDLDHARTLLDAAAQRDECRDDPLLHYNLGFVNHALAERDNDSARACEAAGAYRRFTRLDRTSDAMNLVRDRLAEADARCQPPEPPEPFVVLAPIEPASDAFPWHYVTLGVTGVAFTSAIISGTLALGAATEARDASTPEAHADHSAKADALSTISDVSWGLAVAAAAGTVVLWVWSGDDVSVSAGPTGAILRLAY